MSVMRGSASTIFAPGLPSLPLAAFFIASKIGYPKRWLDYSAIEMRPGDLVGTPVLHGPSLCLSRYQKHDLTGGAKTVCAERDAIWRRLGRIVNGHGGWSIRHIARISIRKQAGRVSIFAQPQQYQVELFDSFQRLRVICGGSFRACFCMYRMYLPARDGNVIQPGLRGHAAIAPGMIGRKTAFIAEIHMPCRPAGIRRSQGFINSSRGIASGQHDMKFAAPADGQLCRQQNRPHCRLFQFVRRAVTVPAARHGNSARLDIGQMPCHG